MKIDEMLNKIYLETKNGFEYVKQIPDKSIDMILCDLPYGTTACKWDVVIPFDLLWEQYKRIIKDKGAIVLTASQPFTTDLINSNRKWFKYLWIWKKDRGGNIFTCKYQPYKNYEDIVVFSQSPACKTKNNIHMNYNPIMTPRKPVTVKNYGKSKIVDADWQVENYTQTYDKKYPKSIIEFNNREKKFHPTQKPIALFEYLIKTYTNEGDIVLDNCIGSGTTAVACKLNKRNFIGMEIYQEYIDISYKRLKGEL
jgi:site-specific DNA-methyltransferase (adenine-specific)